VFDRKIDVGEIVSMSNRKPKKERVRALREEALELLRKGSHAAALVRFVELERLDPEVAEFPRRTADCQRALGNASEQVEALGRAAELYANQGAFAKAIALCKVILGVDPGHAGTRARLAELENARPATHVDTEPQRAKPVPRLPLPPGAGPGVSLPALDMPPSMPAGSVVLSSVPALGQSTSGWSRPRRSLEQMLRLRRAELSKAKLPTGPEPTTSIVSHVDEENDAPESILAPEGPSLDSMLAPEPLPVFDSILVPEPPPAPEQVFALESVPALELVPVAEPVRLPEPALALESEPVPESEPSPDSGSDSAITNRLPPAGTHPTWQDVRLAAPADPRLVAARALPVTALFSELSPDSLSVLIENAKLLHFEPGAVVYRQNDPSDRLFVVASGVVAISTEGENGVEIARLGDNEFFGETALISNELRLSTARAIEPTDVLAIERKTLTELVHADPRILKTVLRFLRERLVASMLLTNPLFTLLTGGERRELVSRFEFVEFDRGTQLVRQRSRSPGIFVLLCGTVEVTRREGNHVRLLALLHAGGVFGEMSLIGRDPAVAEVRSMSRGFALMLPEHEFRRVCEEHPQLLEFVQLLAEARKRQNAQSSQLESVPASL
jgi:CRP-like cAMP-binding protein